MKSHIALPEQKPTGKLLFEKREDEKEVQRLLQQGVNPNYTVSDGRWKGWTPLAYAVYKNKIKLVELLLRYGATAEQCYPGTSKSLFVYSFTEIYETVMILLPRMLRDYNIPFALFRFGAEIPIDLVEEVYEVLLFPKLDPIIRMGLGNKQKFLSQLLLYHMKCKEDHFIKEFWSWEKVRDCIKELSPGSPAILEEVLFKMLDNKEWELAYELIKKGVQISSGMKEPLIWMIKVTNPADFLRASNSNHQNPSKCFEIILAKGFDLNETFEYQGKTWSLLSFAVSHYHFVATKLLLAHGANPGQTLPGKTIAVKDYFPVKRAQEFDSLVCSRMTVGEKESKTIELGIDANTALVLRLQRAIDILKNERLELQKKLENSSARKKRTELEFNEHFLKLQKKFLDLCNDKSAFPETFKHLMNIYSQDLEILKSELYQSEVYKAKTRMGENKEDNLECKEVIIKEHLDDTKFAIARGAICFLDFSVTSEESLRDQYKEWGEKVYKNRQQQKKVDAEYNELIISHHVVDDALRIRLRKLIDMKNDLMKNEDAKITPDLRDYLLDELNNVDQNGFAPLHYACMFDDLQLARDLVAKGAAQDIEDIAYQKQNKLLTIKEYLKRLQPDFYRLFGSDRIVRAQGVEGKADFEFKKVIKQ